MTCPPPGYLFVRSSLLFTKRWEKRFFAFADGPLPLGSLTTVHDKRNQCCTRKRKYGKKAAKAGTSRDGDCERLSRSLAIAAASGCGILVSYRPSDLEHPVDLIDVRNIVDVTLASKSGGKRHTFVVHTATRKILLAAGSEQDVECWISALQDQVRQAKEVNVEATDSFKTNTKLVSKLICGTKSPSLTTPDYVALEAGVAGPSEIEPERAEVEHNETVEKGGPVDSPSKEEEVAAEVPSIENADADVADAATGHKNEASDVVPPTATLTGSDGPLESSSKDEEVTESSSLKSAVVQDPAICGADDSTVVQDPATSGADDSTDQALEGAETNIAERSTAPKDGVDGDAGTTKFFVAISSLFKGKAARKGRQQIPDDIVTVAEEDPSDLAPPEAKRGSSGAVPTTADIVHAEESVSRILNEIVDEAVRNATTETTASASGSSAPVKKELFRLYVPIWARRRSSTPLASVA